MHGAATVNVGRFFQALGHALEILTQHVDIQTVLEAHTGQTHDSIGQNGCLQIDGMTLSDLEDLEDIKTTEGHIQRCLDGGGRNDDQHDHAGKPELLKGELESCKTISNQGTHYNLQNCYC